MINDEFLPSLAEYSPGQWWFKELENIWVLPIGGEVTADMKRAAHIAMNLAGGVGKAQTVMLNNARLRSALEGVVGASDPEELRNIKATLSVIMPEHDPERTVLFAAIDTLLEVPSA